jgi:hypothetical protein
LGWLALLAFPMGLLAVAMGSVRSVGECDRSAAAN